jgi:hypothetical protein
MEISSHALPENLQGSPKKAETAKTNATELKPNEYKINQTYSLNFAELGADAFHDFNAHSFFVDEQPLEIQGIQIRYDAQEKKVIINNEKQISPLTFLAHLGIGLYEGGFKIIDYINSGLENRKNVEEEDEPLLN